jgi:quinol-cytochrome oxidoreductase complex cytochrome b subunit
MSRAARLGSWLEERAGWAPLLGALSHKRVPQHRYSVLYYLGGMTLFFFLVQVVTGTLLLLYYRPGPDDAFESVELLMTQVPFGWLVRSLHSWSSNLMVFFAALHLGSVFFLRAYRRPRELTWVSGALLFLLVLAFSFSGYLLPWNQLAFFATKVGTDIAGALPLVGEPMLRFLRGGDRVTGATLSRFFGWHVCVLPLVTLMLLGAHLVLVQVHGMSVPPREEAAGAKRRPMRFFPHFALRELFGWTLALGVLATLAAVFPWELGEKADPFAPAYRDIRPEWYFVFMFETLKLVPGGEIFGVELEAIPLLFFGLAAAALVVVPFLGRTSRADRIRTGVGAVASAYVVGMTAWGYRSWVPVAVLLGTGTMLALLAWGTRPRGEEPP